MTLSNPEWVQSELFSPKDCEGCGACCMDESPPVKDSELAQIPEEATHNGGIKTVNGVCAFFDPKKRQCTEYDIRPHACRILTKGSTLCLLSRLWVAVDLHWFDAERNQEPSPGQFSKFLDRVNFIEDGLQISSIDGLLGTDIKGVIDNIIVPYAALPGRIDPVDTFTKQFEIQFTYL